jgi:hypothetical protein
MLSIPTFVIGGGDCSGKTTLLTRIREHYADRILIVNEVATLLYPAALNPLPDPGGNPDHPEKLDWLPKFQQMIATAQVAFECQAQKDAVALGCEVIVLDRALFDHYGYLTKKQWTTFEHWLNVNPSVLAPRYSAALYLQSLVIANPDLWEVIRQEEHEARRDRSKTELTALELALRSAWERYREAGGDLTVIEGPREEERHFEVACQIIDRIAQAS